MLLATVLFSTGCSREATGQVVAVVNGQEITLSELNGELRAAGNVAGGDQSAQRNAALQRLIDRKLLVQQAQERNLDKDPDYLQQQLRVNDDLLIGMLGKQATSKLPIPDQSDIDKFIAENPQMFDGRAVYNLDQIVFATPSDRTKLKLLEGDHTMDAVAASLTKLQIKFERREGNLDTASIPADLQRRINTLPPGEPFVLGAANQMVVSVIVGKKTVPSDPTASRALAVEAIRRKEIAELGEKQVKQARAAAKIEYQSGYSAPKKNMTPAPKV